MKLWNYIFLLTGLSILMALAGLSVAGFTDLFNIIGLTVSSSGISDFQIQSTLWTFIFGTTGLLVAVITSGGIGIGTFIYTKDKSFLMIPIITSVFFYWISVFVSVINYSRDYPVFGIVIALVLIPLTVGFLVSSIDYFLGVD
jgi:hypothetical protein